jgi:hypothetical protein
LKRAWEEGVAAAPAAAAGEEEGEGEGEATKGSRDRSWAGEPLGRHFLSHT